jgi:2-haloacid dehalogenase
MGIGIGIDVYGTLIDPAAINASLRPLVGDAAESLAELWRSKQLEYSFRRAAMGTYENFGTCSRQALAFALTSLRIKMSPEARAGLLQEYQRLRAYPDAVSGVKALSEAGYKPVAFSNGVEATVRNLLQHAGILSHLHAVISVDDLKTFKPDPRVYLYLAQRLICGATDTWVVSGNPFDVIGAKSAGLKAAWIRRKADSPFDPWDIHPDLIARDLLDFSTQLQKSFPATAQSP